MYKQCIHNVQYEYLQEREHLWQLLREEINSHLEKLGSWIDEERNLVQFYNHQALTYQQLTLAHHSVLEGLLAKRRNPAAVHGM